MAGRFWLPLLAGAFLVAGTGCGHRMVKVRGKITLDGKPLNWATVAFVPLDGQGPSGNGVSDSDGRFRLTTHNYDDGVLVGDYKVVIKLEEPPPKLEVNDTMTTREVMALYAEAMKERKKHPIELPEIPEVYKDATRTPLKQRVPPSGEVLLELHSDGGT